MFASLIVVVPLDLVNILPARFVAGDLDEKFTGIFALGHDGSYVSVVWS